VVRFDPEYELLAAVDFKKTKPMLYAQLDLKDDVIGRLLAVEALKEHDDKKTLAKLEDVLNNDPFYGVRMSASSALRHIGSDEAFAGLVESLGQADARVRERVVGDVGSFYRPEALAAITKIANAEKNPDIRSGAIRDLGLYNSRKTRKLLVSLLQVKSFHNTIAQAAVSAIRTMDDPYFVSALRKAISQRADEFTTSGLSSALDTLAHISRNEKDKTAIREFITGHVNHENRRIQAGAIGALGTLGDPKAIPIVQAFDGDESYDRVQRAAKSALRRLREQKQLVPREIIELRELVDELKKDNEKLREQFEELNERLDARDEAGDEDK
jgi:HEAT repeat protein